MTPIAVPAFPSSSQDKLETFFAAEAIIRVAMDKITMDFAVFFILPDSRFNPLEVPINAPRRAPTPINPRVSSSYERDDNFLTANDINNKAADIKIKAVDNLRRRIDSFPERVTPPRSFTAATSSPIKAPIAPTAFHISSEGIVVNTKIAPANIAMDMAVFRNAAAWTSVNKLPASFLNVSPIFPIASGIFENVLNILPNDSIVSDTFLKLLDISAK